jgi:membrane peptidoglycan carboxypeptidase
MKTKRLRNTKFQMTLEERESRKRKRRKIALTVCLCLVLIPATLFGAAVGIYAAWASGVTLDKTLLPTASAVPVFFDSDGKEIAYNSNKYITSDEITPNLKNAFVALEDKRFYSHKGYDIIRIGGAIVNDIKAGALIEGGSTITQQLVKNTHLTNERTVKRKLKEIAIASKIEKNYSKDEILSMYLSVIYFGKGAYGVKDAAALYFDKDVSELTLSECAMLAGIIKNPSKYSPLINYDNAVERRNLVLKVMLKEGFIKQSEYDTASCEKIEIKSAERASSANKFYIERASREVCALLGITDYQLNNSGYKIYLNLNQDVQLSLYKLSFDKTNFESEEINNASVVIENKTGRVIAHASSLPYDVRRQAGSALKPVAVYAPALDRSLITLATPIDDVRTDFNGYSPENYGGVYYGKTNPREAIKKSMNSVAVKVMDFLGTDNSVAYLRKFGISVSENDSHLALALGASQNGFSPLEIARAYASLANGGVNMGASYVSGVVSNNVKIYSDTDIFGGARFVNSADGGSSGFKTDGTRIINAEEPPRLCKTNAFETSDRQIQTVMTGNRVVSEDAAYLVTSALIDTVKDGTAKGLSYLPYQIAAKTGTASRSDGTNTDAWNVGYTSSHTVLVWHGADNMREKGGGYATLHAGKVWQSLYRDTNYPSAFMPAENIVSAEIDTYSTQKNLKLVLATEYTPSKYRKSEIFTSATLPSADGSKFSRLEPPQMEIRADGRSVSISFTAEDIYSYKLVRNDVFGEKTVMRIRECEIIEGKNAECIKNDDGTYTFTLSDTPFSLGTVIKYTLENSFEASNGLSESRILSNSTQKSVYLENTMELKNVLFFQKNPLKHRCMNYCLLSIAKTPESLKNLDCL